MQTVTIHSAVSFLDELMMLTDYVTRDWQLYAVCCLSIAGKSCLAHDVLLVACTVSHDHRGGEGMTTVTTACPEDWKVKVMVTKN